MARRYIALLNQVGDFAGDHTGFAATGSRQNQTGAINIEHGFFLARVELGHGSCLGQMGEHSNKLPPACNADCACLRRPVGAITAWAICQDYGVFLL